MIIDCNILQFQIIYYYKPTVEASIFNDKLYKNALFAVKMEKRGI